MCMAMQYSGLYIHMCIIWLMQRIYCDILQDTVIKVLEATPAFENENHEKAYLLKTASNIAKNSIKYNKVRIVDELSEELMVENREDLSFVWETVKSLPEIAREVEWFDELNDDALYTL